MKAKDLLIYNGVCPECKQLCTDSLDASKHCEAKKMTYLKCSCGSELFIRIERMNIVKIRQGMDDFNDEQVDQLAFPVFNYECLKCGNGDI